MPHAFPIGLRINTNSPRFHFLYCWPEFDNCNDCFMVRNIWYYTYSINQGGVISQKEIKNIVFSCGVIHHLGELSFIVETKSWYISRFGQFCLIEGWLSSHENWG